MFDLYVFGAMFRPTTLSSVVEFSKSLWDTREVIYENPPPSTSVSELRKQVR